MAKKRYTKLEREILEILEEKDRQPRLSRLTRRTRRSLGLDRRSSFSPSRPAGFRDPTNWIWLGGSVALALAAVIVSSWSSFLAGLLAIICILYFLSPIALSFRSGPTPPTVHQWRGKDIQLPPQRAGLLAELRQRLSRARRGR